MSRKLFFIAAALLFITSCQKSLEERAADDASEYTRRECPRKIADNILQDSMAFDKDTKTILYYYTLSGPLDNKQQLESRYDEYNRKFAEGIKSTPALKVYVDAGFGFSYVYRSEKTDSILLQLNITNP